MQSNNYKIPEEFTKLEMESDKDIVRDLVDSRGYVTVARGNRMFLVPKGQEGAILEKLHQEDEADRKRRIEEERDRKRRLESAGKRKKLAKNMHKRFSLTHRTCENMLFKYQWDIDGLLDMTPDEALSKMFDAERTSRERLALTKPAHNKLVEKFGFKSIERIEFQDTVMVLGYRVSSEYRDHLKELARQNQIQ